jgi:hypothetical protein
MFIELLVASAASRLAWLFDVCRLSWREGSASDTAVVSSVVLGARRWGWQIDVTARFEGNVQQYQMSVES